MQADTGLQNEQILAAFGYQRTGQRHRPAEQPVASEPTEAQQPTNAHAGAASESIGQPDYRLEFWAVTEREVIDAEVPTEQPSSHTLSETEHGKALVQLPSSVPRHVPLCFEQRTPSVDQEGEAARLSCWLEDLSQARALRLPHQCQRPLLSSDIWIVPDMSERLMLWWPDLRGTARNMQDYFGRSACRILPWRLRLGQLAPANGQEQPLPGGQTVIVLLSDSGQLGNSAERELWRNQCASWRAQGAQVLPCAPSGLHSYSSDLQPLMELLACLSMVQWCSPALLRYWRRLLGASVRDEYALWHHPDVWTQPDGCGLRHRRQLVHQQLFKSWPALRQEQLLTAAAALRQGVSPRETLEELWLRDSAGLPLAAGQQRQLGLAIDTLQHSQDEEQQAWLWRLSERHNQLLWQRQPELHDACLGARRALAQGVVELGPGMDAGAYLKERMGRENGSLSMRLLLDQNHLVFASAAKPQQGITLVEFNCSTEGFEMRAGSQPLMLREGTRLRTTGLSAPLQLHTGSERLLVDRVQSPSWSVETGRDDNGLFARADNGTMCRWRYPGDILAAFEPLRAGGCAKAAWVAQGAWENERPLDPPFIGHEDKFGYYYNLVIPGTGISQRMRWIPPGRFTMGSPLTEPDRQPDEQPHSVTLSQGYWLADTACTQALWAAVMGKNPSHFKGDKKPVENVNWNDVQTFLERINKKLPNVQIQLPSEAQWEYACRAGSETVFSWGDSLSPEQAHYDYSGPYRDGKKEKRQNGTVEVKVFQPNVWGLHQMHGNVWEWCNDWYGDYLSDEALDPQGPSSGTQRVLRGGSWFGSGGWLRSAVRSRGRPDFRDRDFIVNDTGFRFSQVR